MSTFDWNTLPPPEDIAWPLYPADSPSRRKEESKEAFNEDAARAAFGDACMDWLSEKQEIIGRPFCGDWWMLAMLRRCAAYADQIDPERTDRRRFHAHRSISDLLYLHGVRAHIECAELSVAHLEHAHLGRFHLNYARLDVAHLEHAHLSFVNMEHASLWRAHLEHAKLVQANLKRANLKHAHFEHSILREACLEHAHLQEANLDHANVRWATGILFSDNPVTRLDIEGAAPDPWSVLRRIYTGPMYFVHLLLVVGFLLPYAAKVLALTTTARAVDALRTTMKSGETLPKWGQDASTWIAQFDATHIETPALWVLLGGTKGMWWIFVPTAIAILLYNIVRACLTVKIGILRDQADRVQRTPTLEEYYGYCHPLAGKEAGWCRMWSVWVKHVHEWSAANQHPMVHSPWSWRWTNLRRLNPLTEVIGLYRLHLFARVLFWISLLSVSFHIGAWLLTTTVPVPR